MTVKRKIYNVIFFIIALSTFVLAVIDFTSTLTYIESFTCGILYIILAADFIIRFLISKSKIRFLKNNILDLLSIIPLHPAFSAFRLLKIFIISKLIKDGRDENVHEFLHQRFVNAKRFFTVTDFKNILFLTVAAMLISSLLMTHYENMSFGEALWWSIVTAATVGYGDVSPQTNAGRIIAVCLMLIGIGLIGSLTSTLTSFFLRRKEVPTDNESQISSDKTEMVLTLYNTLSDSEKKEFKNKIN